MWTSFKRIVVAGFIGFWRNAFVSFSSVFVMAIALTMIATTLFSNYSLETALSSLQEQVDINVYFVTEAAPEEVLALKASLETLPDVAEVTYVSREDALAAFQAKHEDDELTIQALDELGENPLGAALRVRTKETSQYEGVAAFLEGRKQETSMGTGFIDRVNFSQNKLAIDRLTQIIADERNSNNIKMLILVFVAIFVSFNTMRLVIHNSRDEIHIMRLVGAGNAFITSPFIFSGIMQGVLGAAIVLLLLYPVLLYKETVFYPFPFFDEAQTFLLGYYISHFGKIFGIVMASGIGIGALSSFLAVRRYLHI